MPFWENIPDTLRNVFDDGLDEVLVFAFIFIFILMSGRDNDNLEEVGDNLEILPIIIIAAFLLLFSNFSRSEENSV